MKRTQIYLTEQQAAAIATLAETLKTTQSDVIRIAIERFVDANSAEGRLAALRRGRGIWAKRKDLPKFDDLRRESERRIDKIYKR